MENLPNYFNPIRKLLPKSVVYSDASPSGWEAAFEDQSAVELWTPKEAELNINVLETAAAYFALKLFCKNFKNTAVHLKVDNTATAAFINKQKAPNEVVFTIIKNIWEFCIRRNLWLFASYIKSKRNKVADAESRKLRDNLEWSLHDTLFEKIIAKFGKPDIDLFASRVNFKVDKYIYRIILIPMLRVSMRLQLVGQIYNSMPSHFLRLSPKLFPKSKMKRRGNYGCTHFHNPDLVPTSHATTY